MNTRQKRKLLRRFLKLVESRELNERDYEELAQKLEIELKKGDGAVIELLDKLSEIRESSKSRGDPIKAVKAAIEEFIAKVIAETITRMSRGF